MHNLFQGLILKFRGGKLLLTSLRVYDNLDKNTVICHLEELNKKGVSGFIIKRRKDTVHQKELFELFIHFCDAHGIPVLELPHNISYWAVLKYVLCHAYDLDIAKYLYSEIVQDQINHFLLHERYDEQTIETFFKSLETMVGNSVSLYDENYHCIYPITGQKEFTIIGDEKYVPHITTKHEYIRQKREYVEYIQKIYILNYCHYYLVVTEVNEPLSELDFVTLDNIITALFYLLAQDVTKKELTNIIKGTLKSIPRKFGYHFHSRIDNCRANIINTVMMHIPLTQFQRTSIYPCIVIKYRHAPQQRQRFCLALFIHPTLYRLNYKVISRRPFFQPAVHHKKTDNLILLVCSNHTKIFFIYSRPFPAILQFQVHTAMRTFTVFLIFLIPPCMPTIQTKAIPLCITLEIMHKAMFIGITLLSL